MHNELFMKRAIYLASLAPHSHTLSNPRVGAVLVHQGRIIGEGYHHHQGEAHAEVHCVQSVKPQDTPLISQSTMYVTLEPCAHQGRTPSCARMLAELKPQKVFVGTLDPFPKVAGKGCQILQEAGIEVEVGLLEKECKDLAHVFLANQIKKRPYIILKWAESADGYIDNVRSDASQAPAKLSTPFTQLLTHRLRGDCTGILIGSRTALLDNPSLTNRLWKGLPSPTPIILAGKTTPIPEKYINDPRWMIIPREKDLPSILSDLLDNGITLLLVEGGSTILQSFINAGLWDTIRREISPLPLHTGFPSPTIPQSLTPIAKETFQENRILFYPHP